MGPRPSSNRQAADLKLMPHLACAAYRFDLVRGGVHTNAIVCIFGSDFASDLFIFYSFNYVLHVYAIT